MGAEARDICRSLWARLTVFELHPQLEQDTFAATALNLCTVRLMNCRALPWLVLVPRVEAIREIIELSEDDQQQLMREISQMSRLLQQAYHPDKINVAALGNMVPQLHVHVIARYTNDAAWPKPVWGNIGMEPYSEAEKKTVLAKLGTSSDIH